MIVTNPIVANAMSARYGVTVNASENTIAEYQNAERALIRFRDKCRQVAHAEQTPHAIKMSLWADRISRDFQDMKGL